MKRDTFTATFVKTTKTGALLSIVTDSVGTHFRDHIWVETKYVMGFLWGDTLTFTAEAYMYNGSKIGLKDLKTVKKIGTNMMLVQKQKDYDTKKFSKKNNRIQSHKKTKAIKNVFAILDKISA